MNIDYSNRAFGQLQDILDTIAEALYPEDAIKWRIKIDDRVNLLADTPMMGCAVPHECFLYVPPDVDRLRQLVIRPYRVVYEVIGEQVRILAITRCSALLSPSQLHWDK